MANEDSLLHGVGEYHDPAMDSHQARVEHSKDKMSYFEKQHSDMFQSSIPISQQKPKIKKDNPNMKYMQDYAKSWALYQVARPGQGEALAQNNKPINELI